MTDRPLKKLSSKLTPFCKRIFPTVWCLSLAVATGISLFASPTGMSATALIPLAMLLVGYAIFRRFAFDLCDDVIASDDALIVRRGGRETRLPLSEIAEVRYVEWMNPPHVTVTLREASIFGERIAFVAALGPFFSRSNPAIHTFVQRVRESRS